MTRVLFIPHTSSPGSLATDHAYGWATSFFSKWAERNKNLRVYWPIPRGSYESQRPAFYKLDRTPECFRYIDVDMSSNQIVEQCTLQPELIDLFSLEKEKYYFDCIFCEKLGILGQFLGAAGFSNRNLLGKVIIGNFHYALDTKRHIYTTPFSEITYFANAAYIDGYQFGCGHQCNIDSRRQLLEKSRSLLSSSLVSNILAKPCWVKPCCDIEEVDALYENWKASKKERGPNFRVHYGFSINNNFNYDTLIPMLRKYSVLESDFKYVITTPSIAGPVLDADKDWTEIHIKCDRRKFYEIALNSHVFIMWFIGDHGLNHGSVLEMAMLGVLPIFYANSIPYPWKEDYKYVFRNELELNTLLKYIKKNYQRKHIQDSIEENRQLIKDVYKKESGYNLVIDYVEKKLQEKLKVYPTIQLYADCLKDFKPDTISMTELIALIKEKSTLKVDMAKLLGSRKYYLGNRDNLRTSMTSIGWDDIGGLDEPVFRRKSDTLLEV